MVSHPSLSAGITALNQGNYQQAIAQLQQLCNGNATQDPALVIQAQMHLMLAYRGCGAIKQAEQIRRILAESTDPQVQAWLASHTQPQAALIATTTQPSIFGSTLVVPWRNAPRATSWQPLRGLQLKKSWPGEMAIALAVYGLIYFVLGRFAIAVWLNNLFLVWATYKTLGRYWIIQIAAAVGFFLWLRFTLDTAMGAINWALARLSWLRLQPVQLFYADPTYFLLGLMAVLVIGLPWWLDWLLRFSYNMKPLSLNQLQQKSPEAVSLLRSGCQKRKIPFPSLWVIPTAVPLAFTYGNWPRTARIVVSYGLLEQLTPEEVSVVYGTQLGQILNGDFVLLSGTVLLLQIPYTIYWQLAYWGDRLGEACLRLPDPVAKFSRGFLLALSGTIANLSYSLFWLWRLPLMWISRLRVYYSDRTAASFTGNPNALSRALLKIALGTSQQLQRQGQTSWLLEGFSLLLPVSYQQSMILGGSYERIGPDPLQNLQQLLQWDAANPHRQWLVWADSHPLLGDRIAVLNRYAQNWQLAQEIELSVQTPAKLGWNLGSISIIFGHLQALPLLQRAFIYGLVAGILMRLVMWIVGAIGYQFYIIEVSWFFRNANPFLLGCLGVTFGTTVFILINQYFPDIKTSLAKTENYMAELLCNPKAVPNEKCPVRMSGVLMGRRGIGNWLAQDLFLQTSQGLVKLQLISPLGPLGNLFWYLPRPEQILSRQVTVTGWWRRGSTPWIDVDTMRGKGGKPFVGGYPQWLTLLAIITTVYGAYLIWQA